MYVRAYVRTYVCIYVCMYVIAHVILYVSQKAKGQLCFNRGHHTQLAEECQGVLVEVRG